MLQLHRLSKFVCYLPTLSLILFLTGCINFNSSVVSKNKLMLAEQNPNLHFEQEVMIVRISQILLVGNMSKEERADLHFERGVLYDSLGLWALARHDFTQALSLQPKMAAVYNYLGLYSLLDESYESALEAFNATLELDPSYEYTFFNRGLNFYYMGRYQLAEKDFTKFHQTDTSDPYRLLWIYLNTYQLAPQTANEILAAGSAKLSEDSWGTHLVRYYLGQLTVEELQRKAQDFAVSSSSKYAEILTETYFYLAKQKLNLGQIKEAETLFKLAIANQVYNFVEYRFALLELAKLKRLQAK